MSDIQTPQKPYEFKSILDPNFKYIPAAQTDVQRTWMKYGWKPPERKELIADGEKQ